MFPRGGKVKHAWWQYVRENWNTQTKYANCPLSAATSTNNLRIYRHEA